MEGDYRRCGDCNAYLGFQSTPSAWRETYVSSDAFAASHISIHSLRMEGDAYSTMLFSTIKSFQSTPSAWRETHTAEQYDGQENAFQSTPSAWRETFPTCGVVTFWTLFQSTPSAWRETNPYYATIQVRSHFNPLPPHGGRRKIVRNAKTFQIISIHSLRMEGDHTRDRHYRRWK